MKPTLFFAKIDTPKANSLSRTVFCEQKYAVQTIDNNNYLLSMGFMDPYTLEIPRPNGRANNLIDTLELIYKIGQKKKDKLVRENKEAFAAGVRITKMRLGDPSPILPIVQNISVDLKELRDNSKAGQLSVIQAISDITLWKDDDTNDKNITISKSCLKEEFSILREYPPQFYETAEGKNLRSSWNFAVGCWDSAFIRKNFHSKKFRDNGEKNMISYFIYNMGFIFQTSLVDYSRERDIPLITITHPYESPDAKAYMGLSTSRKENTNKMESDSGLVTYCPRTTISRPIHYFNSLQMTHYAETGKPFMNISQARKLLFKMEANKTLEAMVYASTENYHNLQEMEKTYFESRSLQNLRPERA